MMTFHVMMARTTDVAVADRHPRRYRALGSFRGNQAEVRCGHVAGSRRLRVPGATGLTRIRSPICLLIRSGKNRMELGSAATTNVRSQALGFRFGRGRFLNTRI
eukprot:6043427-Pyramimonas_sp.AAC.3